MNALWALLLFAWVPFIVSTSPGELVFVQTVFRHGARAPIYEFSSNEARDFYFRGLGQLSDLGLTNGKQLGELFYDRYVRTGFLDERMKPDEISFRSSPKERCLMTATEVARGMFPRNISVPIWTYPTVHDDELLYPRICENQHEYSRERFGTDTWSEIFDKICQDTVKARTITNYTRDYLEALKVENYEGLPIPEWARTSPGHEEIEKCFYEFMHYLTGVGRWNHNGVILTKSGLLVNHLLANVSRAWRCHTNASDESDNCPHFKKFHAYSTHDTVVLPVAASLGVLSALNNRLPEYTSALIIELWQSQDGSPYVKVFYRGSPQSHDLIDTTSQVRRCTSDECPLAAFLSCCDEYRIENLSGVCPKTDDVEGFWNLFTFWLFVVLTVLLLVVVIVLALLLIKKRKNEETTSRL